MIKIKRIYDKQSKDDGYRILIDRLWPRGFSKEKIQIDLWLKEIAPSNELRKWYAHDPEKWQDFRKKYKGELKSKSDLLQVIKVLEKQNKIITLLYSSKEERHNNAVALKYILQE